MNLYDQGSYLEAIEGRPSQNIIGLKKIVEDYGSTENGETAKIYLANSYDMLGKPDEALKYYSDYDGDISIYGEGSQTRSFCHVDVMVNAIICMMNTPGNFTGPVNARKSNEFSIQELAKKIIQLTG